MPAQNTGGHYKCQSNNAQRFRSARSVLCSSGRNGHLHGQTESLPRRQFMTSRASVLRF